jgi:hypothetical protein
MTEESSTPKQLKLKLKKLIDDVHSGNEAKISAAIKAMQSNGDLAVLRPLADVLLTELSAKNRQEVLDFLSTLNVSAAVDVMMEMVKDETYLSIRAELLSSLWNSKLNYAYYLADFVEIACEGTFMEALECLTIIENMTEKFEERHILEAQLHLKDYLEDSAPKDPQKAGIISEIALLLKDFSDLEDDDISMYLE